jgi:uncharacterized protein
MTPQERQLVDDLFDRLSKLENAPRDPDAIAAISEGLRKAPNAVYALVQTVLLQDEALRRANSRIQELQAQAEGQHQSGGGFLDSMRETIFGPTQSRGSVPNVPPPEPPNRPVWNTGQAMPQGQSPGQYGQPYGQPSAGPAFGGGGGSFLGTAAAAAAGMVGGSLLLNGIRSMMGGPHYGLTDAGSNNPGASPWSDQSGSSLAREAGIGDVGSGHDDQSRAGMFDSASNDDPSPDYDNRDDSDVGSDDFADDSDFGDDGGSDYA